MTSALQNDAEVLSADACRALFDRVQAFSTGGGETTVALKHRQSGEATWARNRLHTGLTTNHITLHIDRNINGAYARSIATRLDDEALQRAVRSAEERLLMRTEHPDNFERRLLEYSMAEPVLWSDATLALDMERRGEFVRQMIEPMDAYGVYSAGKLETAAIGQAVTDSTGLFMYYPATDVQCSVSVRDTRGTASGWAGGHHYDIAKIDPEQIGKTALEKCQKMVGAVGIEPGRYQTILEPQAVCDLLTPLIEHRDAFDRLNAERGLGPFSNRPKAGAKFNQLVMDRRVTIRSDPMDPDGGFIPFDPWAKAPYQAVDWIEHGVLKELPYRKQYALGRMGKEQPLLNPRSYRLLFDGPTASIDEMISNTERGILVTRFHNVEVVHVNSLLCSGFTRDGIWLIEDGKISKPIKNFRFLDSPMFAFNSIESASEAVRTYSPPYARVAPALKIREFNFVALADAV